MIGTRKFFEVALSITGNVLVYSEFDNVIEIDNDRKVGRAGFTSCSGEGVH